MVSVYYVSSPPLFVLHTCFLLMFLGIRIRSLLLFLYYLYVVFLFRIPFSFAMLLISPIPSFLDLPEDPSRLPFFFQQKYQFFFDFLLITQYCLHGQLLGFFNMRVSLYIWQQPFPTGKLTKLQREDALVLTSYYFKIVSHLIFFLNFAGYFL